MPYVACRKSLDAATTGPDSTQGLQIDGIFGPKTVGTVLFFQQALSRTIPALPVDGSVDPLTWQALVSGMLAC